MAIKKLIYLEPDQHKRVKELARQAKTSETEVIRRAIDAYANDDRPEAARDKRRVMEYVHAHPSGWLDEPSDFFKE